MATFASLFSNPLGSISSITDKVSQIKQDPMGTLFDTLSGSDRIGVEDIKQGFFNEKSSIDGIRDQCLVYLEMPQNTKSFVRNTGTFSNLVLEATKDTNLQDKQLVATLEIPVSKRAKYTRDVNITDNPVAFNQRITTFISARKPVIRINGIVSNKTTLKKIIPVIRAKPQSSLLKKLGSNVLSSCSSMAYMLARKKALQVLKKNETLSKIKKTGGVALGVYEGAKSKLESPFRGLGSRYNFPQEDTTQKKITDCQTFLGVYDACAEQGYLFTIWYLGIKFTNFAITHFETTLTPTDKSSIEVEIEARQVAMAKSTQQKTQQRKADMKQVSEGNMCYKNVGVSVSNEMAVSS